MCDTIQLFDVSSPNSPFFEGLASVKAKSVTGEETRGFAVVAQDSMPDDLQKLEARLKKLQESDEPFLIFKAPSVGFDGEARVTDVGTMWFKGPDSFLDFRLHAPPDAP